MLPSFVLFVVFVPWPSSLPMVSPLTDTWSFLTPPSAAESPCPISIPAFTPDTANLGITSIDNGATLYIASPPGTGPYRTAAWFSCAELRK